MLPAVVVQKSKSQLSRPKVEFRVRAEEGVLDQVLRVKSTRAAS